MLNCGLKNRLRDFFFYICTCNAVFMVFRVYLCRGKTYLTVIVVKRGRSQNMCQIHV